MPDIDEESIPEGELIEFAASVVAKMKSDLEAHSIWLRKGSGLDMIIGGHLRRGTMALESTIRLAKAGAGYDAAALARVVLDHALSAASIAFADDPERESYFFITRQWRHIREADNKLRQHYPDLTAPTAETSAKIQDLVAQTDESWGGERLSTIVKKLDAKDPSGTRLFSWFFDVPYSALSNYVHARALGLRTIVPELGDRFTFDVAGDQQFIVNAVRQGMIGYLALMLAVHQAWGSNDVLRSIVLDPFENFVRRAGPAGRLGVYEM